MRFGQYEILERIAVGGMAEIYRGRAVGDEGFEKPVAIKRVLPAYAGDDDFVSMLVTEARIHASLSHKNIVQIHDLGISEEGEYFIVLEYVDGRDLGALLDMLSRTPSPKGRTLRLSDAVALYIMIELGEGAHFAHELRGPDGQALGLVHRDVSPSNVLVSYSGEVKLSDFGLAKRRTDHSVVGSLKGKLAYMSPEQARGAVLDRRSDVFALGAVLFEMITGRRLREITDDVEGWRQVASGLVPSARPFRPDLPPALERVLSGALAPDPRDRFQDARALVAAAREALATLPHAPTSESTELQGLLKALLPPGTPRLPAAASKVIRLVSEFLSPEREATVTVSPSRLAAGTAVTTITSAPARAPGLTARAEPPPRPRALSAQRTPSPPIAARPPPPPNRWDVDPQRVSFALGTGATMNAAASAALAELPVTPAPAPAVPLSSVPWSQPPTGFGHDAAVAAQGKTGFFKQEPESYPYGQPQPTFEPEPDPYMHGESNYDADSVDYRDAGRGYAGMPAPYPEEPAPLANGGRTVYDEARPRTPGGRRTPIMVRPKDRPRTRPGLVLFFFSFLGLLAAIHWLLVPLPVLRVWSEPARLEIRTTPAGAEVFLDGRRLSALTPTYTEVQRDRRDHELSVHKDGYQVIRNRLRFDRSETLTVELSLPPESRPSFRPMPAPPPVTAAPATRAVVVPADAGGGEPARR